MIIIQIFSKTLCAKREVLKNEKCTWSLRGCICSNFHFANHLLNVSLKRKTNILHHHTAYDYRKWARAVGIILLDVGIRQVSRLSWKCLQIPVSCWQMSQCTTNQTNLIIFRSPGISDAGIQRSVAYTDWQRNRYVLLWHTNGSCSLCCSNSRKYI